MRVNLGRVLAVAGLSLVGASCVAQQGKAYTMADYAEAEKFMSYNVNQLVYHAVERPTFLADGRFWFRDTGPDGVTFMLVDPVKATKTPAFDQGKLAAMINAAQAAGAQGETAPRPVEPMHLNITEFSFGDGGKTLALTLGGRQIRCDLQGSAGCTIAGGGGRGGGRGAGAGRGGAGAAGLSPDKKMTAFIRDNNLWVRTVAGGAEAQLTTDGMPDYGYATDNAGWAHTDNPVVLWSPDSKKIATFQLDQRKVGRMYLVPVVATHPVLNSWHYPLAGDADVAMVERVVIDVDSKKVVRLKMPPDQHRSTICDDIKCRGGWGDVQWGDDGDAHLAFVSTSRDHQHEWLRVADTSTGDVREVMEEVAPKFFEGGNGAINWKYLPKTNEVLWFSEKSNWGQMYLFDLTTGKLKNQITQGDGNVTQVVRVDDKARVIYFLAVGKQAGRDPYFSSLYRVNFDGSGMKLLTPDLGDHAITLSPDGNYFVDAWSTAVTPSMAAVRDMTGRQVLSLGGADITALKAAGWVPPIPITVKARDGKTDLYGFMFQPTKLDATKKYPIVNHVYPGPQTGSCGSRAFAAAHGDMQSLAELGFVVVCIDGMGTPLRSKAFHEFYFGDMGDNTIPDQVAGMKELAAKYPWIDIDKAGIYGHSGGGAATGAAMFHFPDFFKVGISESGNHDNRVYEDDWAEKWTGLEVKNADGTTNYDSQANQNFAKNLKGHLLLAHGTADDNVPINNTYLVVEALIKANKDFDLLIIPNVAHGYGAATQYMTRRRWDYFVRYLAGDTPPFEYKMHTDTAALAAGAGPADEDDSTLPDQQ
jgi:dipeptidyl-peptidase-4